VGPSQGAQKNRWPKYGLIDQGFALTRDFAFPSAQVEVRGLNPGLGSRPGRNTNKIPSETRPNFRIPCVQKPESSRLFGGADCAKNSEHMRNYHEDSRLANDCEGAAPLSVCPPLTVLGCAEFLVSGVTFEKISDP